MTKPLHGSYELKYKTGLNVLQHERGAGKVRILSKQISERNLVRMAARRSDSVIRDTVWISLGYRYIKRVKESIISGESLFEAYMQTRIGEQKSSVRFNVYRDSRLSRE